MQLLHHPLVPLAFLLVIACTDRPAPRTSPPSAYRQAAEAVLYRDTIALGQALERLNAAEGDPTKARCLKEIVGGLQLIEAFAYDSAVKHFDRLVPQALQLFGTTGAPYLHALKYQAVSHGYVGDLDTELALAMQCNAAWIEADSAELDEQVDLLNIIGMNYGLRPEGGDHLTEARYLQDAVQRLDAGTTAADTGRARAFTAWTLHNNLAQAYMSLGDHAGARAEARRALRVLDRIAYIGPYRAIALQTIGRCNWMLDRDTAAFLDTMNQALAFVGGSPPHMRSLVASEKPLELPETSPLFDREKQRIIARWQDPAQNEALGDVMAVRLGKRTKELPPGSTPWMSYLAYEAEILGSMGRTAEGLYLTRFGEQYIDDSTLTIRGIGSSAFKLLLAEALLLHHRGEIGASRSALERLKRVLPRMAVQPTVLRMRTAELELLLLEASGADEAAHALVDEVMREFGLERRPDQNPHLWNRVMWNGLHGFGAHALRQAERKEAGTDRKKALARAIRLLELAVQWKATYQTRAPWEVEDSPLLRHGDPGEQLLRAYWMARADPSISSPERWSACYRQSKAVHLDQVRREEQLLPRLLAPAELARHDALRATIHKLAGSPEMPAARSVYMAYMDTLRARYPELGVGMAMEPTCTHAEVATASRSALLDYYLGDEDLYVLVADRSGTRLERRARPVGLSTRIAQYLCRLERADGCTPVVHGMDSVAHELSTLVCTGLLPADTSLPLVVLPHRELNYINWEALPTPSRPDRYVIESYQMRYQLGLNLLCDAAGSTAPTRGTVATYAASDFSASAEESLRNLPANEEEARTVAELWGGTLWGSTYYKHAQANDVLRSIGDHRLVHLGAHGVAERDRSGACYLAFEGAGTDSRLTREEVAALNTPGATVVLSACRSAVGPILGSEGMNGMARAFHTAGARCVVASGWVVPAGRTKDLMVAFHGYLRAGHTSSVALRMAKLDLLRRYTAAEDRVPYYWAGFVLVGDDAVFRIAPWYTLTWPRVLLALLLAAVMIYRALRKRSKSSLAR